MKPRPSRYNGAILKKLVVFLRRVELFCIQLGQSKKEERLRCVESFAIAEWKLWRSGKWAVGFRKRAVGFRKRAVGFGKRAAGFRKRAAGFGKWAVAC